MIPTTYGPRRLPPRGFTLIEAIVIIVIIGVLATLIVPRLTSRIGQAKQSTARSNAAALAGAMELFLADCGPPAPGATLSVLLECPPAVDPGAWHGPYVKSGEALIDPWQRPFMLRIPGRKNADFDIVSYGADGQEGGEKDNADIVAP